MRRTAIFLLLMLMAFLTGCVYAPAIIDTSAALGKAEATGDAFAPVEVPSGKSAIYLYRKSQFSVTVIPVQLNGKPFTWLQTGAFEVAIVEPGVHELRFPERLPPRAASDYAARLTNARAKNLQIQIPAGASAFFEGETRRGIGQENWDDIFIYFSAREREAALPEIAKTKRSINVHHERPLQWLPPN